MRRPSPANWDETTILVKASYRCKNNEYFHTNIREIFHEAQKKKAFAKGKHNNKNGF
jgi:hypothetical protein